MDELNGELDLDNLDLDLDNVDEMDSESLQDFGEVNLVINEPHIKFDRADLDKVIDLANTIVTAEGNDIVSKSVCISVNQDRILFKTTDYTNYLTYSAVCQNTENVLQDTVVIPLNILIKVKKALGKTVAILKKDNQVYISLAGGNLAIDTHQVNTDKYQAPGEKGEKLFTSTPETIHRLCKDYLPLVNDAVQPEHKKIILTKDQAFFSSMLIAIQYKGDFSDLVFKKKDIEMIKKLSQTDGTIDFIKVSDGEFNRIVVSTDSVEYSFIASKETIDEKLSGIVSDITSKPGTYIDLVHLYRLVELGAELPGTISKINCHYDEQNLIVDILTKKGESTFTLQGSSDGLLDTTKTISIQAKQLKKLLQSFAGTSSVKVIIDDKGLGICSDYYNSVLLLS